MLPENLAREVDRLTKTLPKNCRYKRVGTVTTKTDFVSGERADVSLVSVESVDRDKEVVLAGGMQLEVFRKNPIVTFAHKYDDLPVGSCQWIKTVPGGLLAKTVYSKKPEGWEGNWFVDAVYSMIQEGVIRGKSVGFLPLKIRGVTSDEISAHPEWEQASAVIEEASLIEYAIAPVPVNQDALVQSVAKGLTDKATLARLGLKLPSVRKAVKKKAKPVDLVAEFAKHLEAIKINPDRILALIKEKYRA